MKASLDGLLRDLRHGARRLLRRPAWTLNAVGVLALGLGAAITLYSALYAVLLRPLPFVDADEVVKIMPVHRQTDTASTVPYRSVVAWRQLSQLESLAVYRSRLGVVGDDAPQRVAAAEISVEYLPLLGVTPLRGRLFSADDYRHGTATAIIESDLWRSRFGADEQLIGRNIIIDGVSTQVIGVVEREYDDAPADLLGWRPLWLPLQVDEDVEVDVGSHGFGVVARLADGASLEALNRELDVEAQRLETIYPDTHRGWGAQARTAPDLLLADAKGPLWLVGGAALLLLLIACSNVAHLFLAQAPQNLRRAAICRALGASTGRILRQVWSESLLISLLGAAIGWLLAYWAVRWIAVFGPVDLPRLDRIGLDRHVLWVAIALALVTALLSGLVPALGLRQARGVASLSLTYTRGGGSDWLRRLGIRRLGLRHLLVVGEVAICLLLLLATGSMLRSLWQLEAVDPGFDVDDLLVLRLDLPPNQFPDPEQRLGAAQLLEQTLRQLPRVESAGLILQEPPIKGFPHVFRYWIEGAPPPDGVRYTSGWFVSGGYQRAMGLRLQQGRWFEDHEYFETSTHLVINSSLANAVWPGEPAVGRHLMSGTVESPKRHEIIGVVDDVAYAGPGVTPNLEAEMYVPWGPIQRQLTAVIRGDGIDRHTTEMFSALRSTVLPMTFPGAPVLSFESGQEILAASLAKHRVITQLLTAFAVLTLALAAAGLFGLLSYQVAQQRQEIGLRMALGASASSVARAVTWQGMGAVILGLLLGAALFEGAFRVLAAQIDGMEAADPWTYAVAAGLLLVVAWAASWWPARRASRIHPTVALRWD